MRSIEAAAVTASEAQEGYAALLAVDLDFASGNLRLSDAHLPVTFPDGRSFDGIGEAGIVSQVAEGIDGRAERLELLVSVLDADPSLRVSEVLNENLRGRLAELFLVFLDDDNAVVVDPVKIFGGRMDNFVFRRGARFVLGVAVDTVRAQWDRPREIRMNDGAQQKRFPGQNDGAFKHVARMRNLSLEWGRPVLA